MNSRLRRSRTFWPDALTVAGVGEGHTHMVAPRYKRIFLLAMVVIVSLTLAVAAMWWRIILSGPYRDEQVRQIQEEIRQGQCDLLDTFPEGVPSLERARTKYECGPGIPIGLLTPEERAALPTPPIVTPPKEPSNPPPPLGSAAVPDPPRTAPNTPGPDNTAPPTSPEPGPVVDPGPVTDLLCEATGVCV